MKYGIATAQPTWLLCGLSAPCFAPATAATTPTTLAVMLTCSQRSAVNFFLTMTDAELQRDLNPEYDLTYQGIDSAPAPDRPPTRTQRSAGSLVCSRSRVATKVPFEAELMIRRLRCVCNSRGRLRAFPNWLRPLRMTPNTPVCVLRP